MSAPESAGSADKRAARHEREAEEIEAVEDRLSSLAGRAGIASLMEKQAISAADLLSVLGGVRGLCETLVPGVLFVLTFALAQPVFGFSQQKALQVSLAASLGIAVVFLVIRVLQRGQTRPAVAGLIAVSASAVVALVTGNPNDNYLPSLLINAAYAAAMLVSLVIGWPLIGLLMGFLMGDGIEWRSNTRRRRVMIWLTLMWFALFGLRLLAEVPLYLAGNNTVGLGVVRLLMGTPLYAVVLVLTWMITKAVYPPSSSTAAE